MLTAPNSFCHWDYLGGTVGREQGLYFEEGRCRCLLYYLYEPLLKPNHRNSVCSSSKAGGFSRPLSHPRYSKLHSTVHLARPLDLHSQNYQRPNGRRKIEAH